MTSRPRLVILPPTCARFVRMLRLRAALGGVLVMVCLVTSAAAPTSFELVHFASGGMMPIAGHRIDGEAIVLELRGGGQVRCDPRLIDLIELDRTPRATDAPVLATVPSERSGLRVLERPYGGLIQRAAEAHGVDTYLIHALARGRVGLSGNCRLPSRCNGLDAAHAVGRRGILPRRPV